MVYVFAFFLPFCATTGTKIKYENGILTICNLKHCFFFVLLLSYNLFSVFLW